MYRCRQTPMFLVAVEQRYFQQNGMHLLLSSLRISIAALASPCHSEESAPLPNLTGSGVCLSDLFPSLAAGMIRPKC